MSGSSRAHMSFLTVSRILMLGTRRRVIYNNVWNMNQPLDGGYIFAGNHPTSLDPIYVYDLIYRPVILATDFVFHLPFVGWMFKGMGAVSVPILEGDPKRHNAYCDALNALCCGRNLLVAPEGKMSQDQPQPKSGIARLSKQTSKAIVPIGIRHNGRIYTFHLCNNGHRQKIRWMPRGWTEIRIGSPIYPSDQEGPIELVNRVMREIRRLSTI